MLSKFTIHAQLALVAYGTQLNLNAKILEDRLTNDDWGVGMAAAEAKSFSDAGWKVKAQFNDSTSGASATLFTDISGRCYVACRGTELAWNDLLTDVGLATIIPSTLTPQLNVLKTQIQSWIDSGAIRGDFTFTGHSLGGYLAAALKNEFSTPVTRTFLTSGTGTTGQTRPYLPGFNPNATVTVTSKATDAYVFNAPGFGGIAGSAVQKLSDWAGFDLFRDETVHRMTGAEGISFIAGTGAGIGVESPIQIEGADGLGFGNHSMWRIVDALEAYELYKQALGISLEQFNQIANLSGANRGTAPNEVLDVLRRALWPTGSYGYAPTADDREKFYDAATVLKGSAGFLNAETANLSSALTVRILDDDQGTYSAANLYAMAQQAGAEGAAIRRALDQLSPLAIVTDALPDIGFDSHPPAYWQDKAAFLERLTWFNETNKAAVDPTLSTQDPTLLSPFQLEQAYYEDARWGLKIEQGPVRYQDSTKVFLFGAHDSQAPQVDLTALGGGSHLYGDTNNKALIGGLGRDVLVSSGGQLLQGAEGDDTYYVQAGDTVVDSAGADDAVQFASGISASAVSCSQSGMDLLFAQVDATLLTVKNWFSGNDSQVENFKFADGTTWDLTHINGLFAPAAPTPQSAEVPPAGTLPTDTAGDNLYAALSGDYLEIADAGGQDQLTLDWATIDALRFWRQGDDLAIDSASDAPVALIRNQFLVGNAVETFKFTDGTQTGDSVNSMAIVRV